jgi:hypothetical protein
MMKRIALVLIAALTLGATAFAQSNFTAATPQFLAFDLGAGFGYSISDIADYHIGVDQAGGVINIGFKISVLDNLGVGFDSLITRTGNFTVPLFAGIRLTYNFIPLAGAAIGFGITDFEGSPPSSAGTYAPAITLGIYGDLFQTRSAIGITTGLKLRLDYVTTVKDIAKGTITFTPAFNFGL